MFAFCKYYCNIQWILFRYMYSSTGTMYPGSMLAYGHSMLTYGTRVGIANIAILTILQYRYCEDTCVPYCSKLPPQVAHANAIMLASWLACTGARPYGRVHVYTMVLFSYTLV